MSNDFDAIFAQGHLVPLQPVNLREQERVRVHVVPADAGQPSKSTNNFNGMTLHDALAATGLLGSVHGGPADLSTNPKYMEGFGEHDRDPH